jgi:hypothetical protein
VSRRAANSGDGAAATATSSDDPPCPAGRQWLPRVAVRSPGRERYTLPCLGSRTRQTGRLSQRSGELGQHTLGTRSVRAASETAGPQRAGAVTTRKANPQVTAPEHPGPRPLKHGESGFESHPTLPRAGGPCQHSRRRRGRASPCGRVGAYVARPCERRPHQPAIHSGPDQSRADNHGHSPSGLNLHHSLHSQVTISP